VHHCYFSLWLQKLWSLDDGRLEGKALILLGNTNYRVRDTTLLLLVAYLGWVLLRLFVNGTIIGPQESRFS
jgi:hypothetical protein